MTEWFLDPKSLALMSGAVIQLAITWWSSRQTAAIVVELVAWRLNVVQQISTLEARVEAHGEEIMRLRSAREGQA